MEALKIRNKQRLRQKELKQLEEQFFNELGIKISLRNAVVEKGTLKDIEVLIINGEILGILNNEKPFLTVRGLLRYRPEKKYATVDMGAVKFIYNGADVMSPGIVDVDLNVKEGDMVWVRDEKNRQPLAVGIALINGPEMIKKEKGKAVKSIHYVSDYLWNFDEPK